MTSDITPVKYKVPSNAIEFGDLLLNMPRVSQGKIRVVTPEVFGRHHDLVDMYNLVVKHRY